jgi:hypothetical protein
MTRLAPSSVKPLLALDRKVGSLRRWTHGPPAPGVIRTTARNRVDTQPHRTVITMKAAPALAAPPVMAWTPPGLYRGMIAVNRGSHHATRRRPR